MRIFENQTELIHYAQQFLLERASSLKQDSTNCIKSSAIFPSVLYTFATINLMGCISTGVTNKKESEVTKNYMKEYMYYSDDQIEHLMKIWRHKTVHLARPKDVIEDSKNRKIAWVYNHNDSTKHLKLIAQKENFSMTSKINLSSDYRFHLSILHFAEDVVRSIEVDFLPKLKKSSYLQDNFESVIGDIYNYKK